MLGTVTFFYIGNIIIHSYIGNIINHSYIGNMYHEVWNITVNSVIMTSIHVQHHS